MEEFEVLHRIIAKKYFHEGKELVEKNVQKAQLVTNGVDDYFTCRFDFEEDGNFLPFFNQKHDNVDASLQALNGLTSFCDYIVAVQYHGKLYLLLIEMKSGKKTDGATMQLDATELFVQYLQKSAERVAPQNNYHSFDAKNIILKKIILKPSRNHRPTTQKRKDSDIVYLKEIGCLVMHNDQLPLKRICRFEG